MHNSSYVLIPIPIPGFLTKSSWFQAFLVFLIPIPIPAKSGIIPESELWITDRNTPYNYVGTNT